MGSGLWRYQNFSGDGRLRAISSHCGRGLSVFSTESRKSGLLVEGVRGVGRRRGVAEASESTRAPCRPALPADLVSCAFSIMLERRGQEHKRRKTHQRGGQSGNRNLPRQRRSVAGRGHHFGRRRFTGGQSGRQRIATRQTRGHGERGRRAISRLGIQAAQNRALDRRIEFLHQRRRAHRGWSRCAGAPARPAWLLRRRACR